MSAYITLATPMVECDVLVDALADVGFDRSSVEIHEQAAPLVGYDGRSRGQVAHIVIRRQFVGAASNDIGFEKTTTGYRAYISDYDRGRYGAEWLSRLHERYRHHARMKTERLERETREAEARERVRLEAQAREEERVRLVEAQRQSVVERAKKLGYRVEESREGETIRLVLVKRVY